MKWNYFLKININNKFIGRLIKEQKEKTKKAKISKETLQITPQKLKRH